MQQAFQNSKSTTLALIGLVSLVTTPLFAYEQGSYFLFDIVAEEGEAISPGRVAVHKDLFKETKSNLVLGQTGQGGSEFEFQPKENFGLGQSSSFGTDQSFGFVSLETEEPQVEIQSFDFSLRDQEELSRAEQ